MAEILERHPDEACLQRPTQKLDKGKHAWRGGGAGAAAVAATRAATQADASNAKAEAEWKKELKRREMKRSAGRGLTDSELLEYLISRPLPSDPLGAPADVDPARILPTVLLAHRPLPPLPRRQDLTAALSLRSQDAQPRPRLAAHLPAARPQKDRPRHLWHHVRGTLSQGRRSPGPSLAYGLAHLMRPLPCPPLHRTI